MTGLLEDERRIGRHAATERPGRRDALHGYGLDDLHGLAMYVVRSDRWLRGTDIKDRYDAAWHGIVEHLLTVAEPPSRHDLFLAGRGGCDQLMRQDMQAHGYNYHRYSTGPRPSFERYWLWESAPTNSPEAGIVDRYALWQIWPTLTPRQQEALTALAATGDYQQAADHLSVRLGTLHKLLSKGRRRFRELWHEGETPSRMWGTDRRVGSRTATTAAVTKRRPASRAVVRRTGRPERELAHGKPSTYTNHECRCTRCTKAATDEARERRHRQGAVPRRRVTVSQFADIRRRREAGETLVAIAADLGFTDSYLSRLLSGARKPAPDPS